jgi:hypothetical protein
MDGSGGRLVPGSQLDVTCDVTEYTMAVTDQSGEPLAVTSRAPFLGELQGVPIILVDIGMFGFGGLIFVEVFFCGGTSPDA